MVMAASTKTKHPGITLCLFLTLAAAGCGSGGTSHVCGSSLGPPLTGSGGTSLALAGIGNGSSIPCTGLSGGQTCSFTANFTVSQLSENANAQLVVEVCTDADGKSFQSENPGQSPVFVQPGQLPLEPGSSGGSLDGSLGPPVSTQVRFALQVNLLDANGVTSARSEVVSNLAPE